MPQITRFCHFFLPQELWSKILIDIMPVLPTTIGLYGLHGLHGLLFCTNLPLKSSTLMKGKFWIWFYHYLEILFLKTGCKIRTTVCPSFWKYVCWPANEDLEAVVSVEMCGHTVQVRVLVKDYLETLLGSTSSLLRLLLLSVYLRLLVQLQLPEQAGIAVFPNLLITSLLPDYG